jgi:hypothetical protein
MLGENSALLLFSTPLFSESVWGWPALFAFEKQFVPAENSAL